jgi:hypothetical protein
MPLTNQLVGVRPVTECGPRALPRGRPADIREVGVGLGLVGVLFGLDDPNHASPEG